MGELRVPALAGCRFGHVSHPMIAMIPRNMSMPEAHRYQAAPHPPVRSGVKGQKFGALT